ncbi:HU family DNA-binding protein [Lysobacter sp. CA199]|uniref:HU family DNA-binding protein n=1 Tax=Lysobacter sp. CA199 TaxID=3455608 RepID=UPI003F8D25A0
MTKQDLINALSDRTELTKTDCGRLLDGLVATVHDSLKHGAEVSIPGVGKFSVKRRNARQGRNPQTGESVDIAAKTVPVFSAAKGLKDAVA